MDKGKPLSLLIVDDNAYMRTMVAIVARAAGVAEVDEAESGPAALERLRTRRHSAITVDLKMEPINGVEFVRMLRRSADSPDPSAAARSTRSIPARAGASPTRTRQKSSTAERNSPAWQTKRFIAWQKAFRRSLRTARHGCELVQA